MTEDDWREYLLQVAECGSDCLRDTLAEIPPDMREGLVGTVVAARIIAMAADEEIGK